MSISIGVNLGTEEEPGIDEKVTEGNIDGLYREYEKGGKWYYFFEVEHEGRKWIYDFKEGTWRKRGPGRWIAYLTGNWFDYENVSKPMDDTLIQKYRAIRNSLEVQTAPAASVTNAPPMTPNTRLLTETLLSL